METNSKRNRILCSNRSAIILKEQWPDIDLHCRGKIAVKGKGDMVTWWVNKHGKHSRHGGSGHDSTSNNNDTESSFGGDIFATSNDPTKSRAWLPATADTNTGAVSPPPTPPKIIKPKSRIWWPATADTNTGAVPPPPKKSSSLTH